MTISKVNKKGTCSRHGVGQNKKTVVLVSFVLTAAEHPSIADTTVTVIIGYCDYLGTRGK